jgi:hypothetical protein
MDAKRLRLDVLLPLERLAKIKTDFLVMLRTTFNVQEACKYF